MTLEEMTCVICDTKLGYITWNCDDGHDFYCLKHGKDIEK